MARKLELYEPMAYLSFPDEDDSKGTHIIEVETNEKNHEIAMLCLGQDIDNSGVCKYSKNALHNCPHLTGIRTKSGNLCRLIKGNFDVESRLENLTDDIVH